MQKLRKRYVVFEIVSDCEIGRSEFVRALGEYFPPEKKPHLIQLKGNKGIVGCAHTAKDYTIGQIASIKKIGDVPVKIRTVGTSGTLKKTFKKYFKKYI